MTPPKILTADEARALLRDATPGPWCVSTSAGEARLMAAAPDLAVTVIHLHAEIARLTRERDQAAADVARAAWVGLELPLEESPVADVGILCAVVRDLTRTVVGERDEATTLVDRQRAILRGVADALRGPPSPLMTWSHHDLPEIARALHAEVERLRAIIEGRTTPPTDAEIAALIAAGGSWRVVETIRCGGVVLHVEEIDDARRVRDLAPRECRQRWWALDAQHCPCAWPVVGGDR